MQDSLAIHEPLFIDLRPHCLELIQH
jgi:hypothetical protein